MSPDFLAVLASESVDDPLKRDGGTTTIELQRQILSGAGAVDTSLLFSSESADWRRRPMKDGDPAAGASGQDCG